LIWKFEDRVLDANMMPVLDSDGKPRLTTTRQDFSAAAFSAFFRLTLNLNGAVGNKSAEAQIALEIPITLRTLFGTGIQDVAFVERALGTKSTLFFGSEPKLLVGLGNISVVDWWGCGPWSYRVQCVFWRGRAWRRAVLGPWSSNSETADTSDLG
jgi:hypothetical protein